MKCVVFLSLLAFSMAQDLPTLPTVSPVTLPDPQEPSLEALIQVLNQILESLGLPTVDPETVTVPETGAPVEGGRVKRDLFSGVTGLPSSPLAQIIELLNQILASLSLPTVDPETVTVPSGVTGRAKRDVNILPVTDEPSLSVLIETLDKILEALHLPTIDPEEVTVPGDVTTQGRAKRDVLDSVTLPSSSSSGILSTLVEKIQEIIAKLESLGSGVTVPDVPISRATRLPVTVPVL